MYEGALDFPQFDRWWRIIEKYRVNIFYTSPTAIRALIRQGEQWPDAHDLSSLRLLGSVGEPINPAAWEWYHRVIGKGRCPIVDTWWQTETGGDHDCAHARRGAAETRLGHAADARRHSRYRGSATASRWAPIAKAF